MERSLKEKRVIKRYEKDKKTFENSELISERNKELVDTYIRNATSNRLVKTTYPYSYNSLRYTIMKKICEEIFPDRDIDTLTQDDLIKFDEDLQQNKIMNTHNKEPKSYSNSYKAKFGKILMEFFKYYFGRDKESYGYLVLNQFGNKVLTTNYERYKEKPYLTYQNIRKIIRETNDLLVAVYFAVMFDGGPRIEAFLNTKFSDIIEKEGEKQNYFIFNFPTFSKHKKGATVALYLFYNTIKEYIEQEKLKEDYSPNNYFFPKSSQWCNRIIKETIKKHFGEYVNGFHYKTLHNHSCRHSSATHYAVNVAKREFEIYRRYGWAFGSSEAREYIQMISARDTEEEKLFRQSSVADETRKYRNELKELTEKLDKLTQENEDLKDNRQMEVNENLGILKDYQKKIEEQQKTNEMFSKLLEHLPDTPEKEKIADKFYNNQIGDDIPPTEY